jgi:hypothetical protein
MVRRRRGAGSAARVAGLVLVGLAAGSIRAAQPTYTRDNAPATPKVEGLALKGSVSQYGITWTFDKPARVGQFVNGDYYVLGPVTVASVDPPFETDARPLRPGEDPLKQLIVGGDNLEKYAPGFKKPWTKTIVCTYARNGSILNPPFREEDFGGPGMLAASCGGFDSRTKACQYDPRLSVRVPIRMKPGDALISSVSLQEGGRVMAVMPEGPFGSPPWVWKEHIRIMGHYDQFSPVKTTAVLTCLGEAVPPDAFRPSFADRHQQIRPARNLRRDLLPTLPRPASVPKLADWERVFERPWTDINYWSFDAPMENMPIGSGECTRAIGGATLLLCLDFTPQEKERLLIELVQLGIDTYGRCSAASWAPQGMSSCGRKWPIIFAGLMLGDQEMQSPATRFPQAVFGEDLETMRGRGWTGATALYTGPYGPKGYPGNPLRGAPCENLHPSRWTGDNERSRRSVSVTWVAEALAARLLRAEKTWNNEVFFDYVDRWMIEDDAEFVEAIQRARGEDFTAPQMRQQQALDPFVNDMWARYRGGAGPVHIGSSPVETSVQAPMTIGQNREFRLNGKPFLPVMLFAQAPEQVDDALSMGINTFVENGSTSSNREFLGKLREKGLHGILGPDAEIAGQANLLGWIHIDQPDKPTTVKEASIVLGDGTHCTGGKPIDMVDGDPHSGAYLDPVKGAEAAVFVPKETPAIHAIAITQAWAFRMAKDFEFSADGKPFFRVSVAEDGTRQEFKLPVPVVVRERVAFKVLESHPSFWDWCDIQEIELLDKDGRAVPLYTTRRAPVQTPEQVAGAHSWMRGAQTTAPVFLTLSPAFMKSADDWDQATKGRLYPEYVKQCEVVGVDIPPSKSCAVVADAVSELRALAGPDRPIIVWLDSAEDEGSVGTPTKAQEVRAAAWAAIIRGATGIGYRSVGRDGDLKSELKRLHEQITQLAPAIVAEPAQVEVEVSMGDGVPCHFKATQLEGVLYMFAQNLDAKGRAGKAAIHVEGLGAGTQVEVVDEGRVIVADKGQFTDEFRPLAVHIYKLMK